MTEKLPMNIMMVETIIMILVMLMIMMAKITTKKHTNMVKFEYHQNFLLHYGELETLKPRRINQKLFQKGTKNKKLTKIL